MEDPLVSLNKILLIGNVGRDPERGVTLDRVPFTRFSLAVSRRYKTATGEKREETDWFQVVAWRQLAETTGQYLSKGATAYVEGRVTHRRYTDRNGIERIRDEVIAEDVKFIKKGGSQEPDIEHDDLEGFAEE
jgi:single-strand DNA-binding protein